MAKTSKTVRKLNAAAAKRYADSINAAADMGFDMADGYESAVALVATVKGNKGALDKVASLYVCGYVARRLKAQLGNLDRAGQYERAAEVIAKASPESSKADRRTDAEHKAVRSAQTSLASIKRAAGIAPTKAGGRKPRAGSNAKEGAANTNDAPKLSLAAPKLDDNADAYFASAIAALLATVDVNADRVSKPWSDFINATYQRAIKAKLIPSAE